MAKNIALIALLSLAGPALWAQAPGPAPAQTPAAVPAPTVEARVAGQDVPVPARRKYVAPEYPADAAAEGVRGIVILDVLIGENGKVESARVARSVPGLDEAAMAAVRLWEYEPTKLAGKPVKVRLSQPITFALRLPDLQRAAGIPELKSGGAPPSPANLTAAASASVMVEIGSQGEVREAALLEGSPSIGEPLLRAVKAWRFAVSPGAAPLVFTIRADWSAGPPPALTLKALEPKSPTADGAPASAAPEKASTSEAAPAVQEPPAISPVDTDVLPARPDPPAKEQGASGIADVILGDNIPELVRGRHPVWPPLARLGNVMGEVAVRFSVDLAGKVTVHSAEGPDLLKGAADQAVSTWVFRRTAIDRVDLIATFKFGPDRTFAKVERVLP